MLVTSKNLEVKQRLLSECLRIQNIQIQTAKSAMDEAQQSANEHQGVGIEDKFESFRESCQIQRDMFAKQLDEAIIGLTILKRIVAIKQNKVITFGSVVHTDQQKYFISASIGEINLNGEKYFAISTMSPIFKAMADKASGEAFTFRDKVYQVENVF